MIANAKDFQIIERHGDLAIAHKLVGARGFTLIQMVGNTMLIDLSNRRTEREIRDRANQVWKEQPRLRVRFR